MESNPKEESKDTINTPGVANNRNGNGNGANGSGPQSRPLWRNTLTYIGSALALLSGLSIFTFLFIELITPNPNPYLGLFTFLILPVILIIGSSIALLGLILTRLRTVVRAGKGALVEYYPHIDLRKEGHRKALIGIGAAVALATPFVAFMSYQGYHYTDSNEFCGQVCHTVMESQYLAHKQSPHSRVECATCHIGRGASWYVKSKISGIRQVIAVARNSYPRPIPSAIKELRPARETCERCHWPQKFYGDQLVTINHFSADDKNTLRPIRMLVKTGGNDPTTGPPGGVHWHMALGHTIEFIATDEDLQEIPWVRATDQMTNAQRIFRSDGLRSSDPPPDGEIRLMDCMSCHNRATHIFREPWRAADQALMADPELVTFPYAKRELVNAVSKQYPTKEEGSHAVATAIEDFYLINYPDLVKTKRPALERLIAAGRRMYSLISFPEMNITWKTYPNNIGHKNFPGCFRCHAGDHVEDNGRPISHACGTCHTFLTPEGGDSESALIRAGDFIHPIDLKGKHADLRCDKCHDGGPAPKPTCEGCHHDQVQFFAGETEEFQSFGIEYDAMDGMVECEDCHDLSQPLSIPAVAAACTDCHEDEEYGAMLEQWSAEITDLLRQASSGADAESRKVLKVLRRVGPMHNIEAARTILTELSSRTLISELPEQSESEEAADLDAGAM